MDWRESERTSWKGLIHQNKILVAIILIKFLHKKHMDFWYEVIGDQSVNQMHMTKLRIFNYRFKITLTLL